jgi:hypothetical protein
MPVQHYMRQLAQQPSIDAMTSAQKSSWNEVTKEKGE